MSAILRRNRRQRSGSYSIMFAGFLVVLLGFSALAIDFSYVNLVQVQAQNAADAGSHAALVALSEDGDVSAGRAAAEEMVAANLLAGEPAEVDSDDVTFGGWDFDNRAFDGGADYTNAVHVNVEMSDDSPNGALDLSLTKVFGDMVGSENELGTATLRGGAVGAYRYRDILIVLDVTLSFIDEIASARAALVNFLALLQDQGYPNDRIGLVVFTHEAAVYTPLTPLDEISSSAWGSLDVCDANAAIPVSCLNSANVGLSGTNQATALRIGVEHLVDNRPDNPGALQTLILITDGIPYCQGNCDCAGGIRAEAVAYSESAAIDDNISVYSVAYYDPNGTDYDGSSCAFSDLSQEEISAFMETLIQGYGEFFEVDSSEVLDDSLGDIARDAPIALVR